MRQPPAVRAPALLAVAVAALVGLAVAAALALAGPRSATGSPSPVTRASRAPAPGNAPTATPAGSPTPTVGGLVGISVPRRAGTVPSAVVAGLQAQFGRLPVARVFSSSPPPASWGDDPTLAALGAGSAVVYSFKGDVAAAAAGAYDGRLSAFLGSRPPGVAVWVTFQHEPEDDIAAGRFTPGEFRAATEHLAPVVRAAGGVPTLVLMQYTLAPGSGRDWRDYYSPAVDVIAWDAYNNGRQLASPVYNDPASFVAPVLAVAAATGKAFGWAEYGSTCIATDPGCTGRADWLRDVTGAFRAAGARFAVYWDDRSDVDFTLRDPASVAAFRALMAG